MGGRSGAAVVIGVATVEAFVEAVVKVEFIFV